MRKLISISQFESESKNQLVDSKLHSIVGGSNGSETSKFIEGTTAAGSNGTLGPDGDTDCSSELVNDYGETIMILTRY